jgi:hypothetical protein
LNTHYEQQALTSPFVAVDTLLGLISAVNLEVVPDGEIWSLKRRKQSRDEEVARRLTEFRDHRAAIAAAAVEQASLEQAAQPQRVAQPQQAAQSQQVAQPQQFVQPQQFAPRQPAAQPQQATRPQPAGIANLMQMNLDTGLEDGMDQRILI